jgi:hypothetical protein
MPTKVSEKNLLLSLTLFATAIVFLFSAQLFTAPVIISEKGILFILLGIIAVLFSIRFLKKSISRL